MQRFLRDLQDRYLLILCFFSTMTLYVFVPLDAILQLGINFAVAFIAIASKRSEQTNISAEKVETPKLQTQSIDNSTINAETLNNAGDGEDKPKGE
jgi:hypothetical protein